MSARKRRRSADVKRETGETKVSVSVVLDGSGRTEVDIRDEFLRHMVETLGRYSGVDLSVSASGDIDHHIVEDVAITLGRAFREAIGAVPVRRISSAKVPMDESLVEVSLDLVDRPFVHLEMPDVLYEHFLRSFAMELRATMHSEVVRGKDAHHVIEATFKALGLALKGAMEPLDSPLSTKSSVKWGSS